MGLQTLRSIYKDKGQEFINSLFNSYVIVCEQIDGSRFLFQKQVDDTIVYYKGAGKEISNIERTMMRFYEKAISYIDNLNIDTIEKIPDNWTFGFQYFPSLNPINIAYDRLPKNNLILTDISIRNESGKIIKIINDPKVLNSWSDILEVERPPFIFTGKLSDEQKNKIKNFLETNEQDLKELFKSNSFTRYIISILNPELKTSALSNSLDKSIEGIIFKFIKPGEKEYYSAKLIDPILHELRRNKKPGRKPNHMYQIAMLDIVEFIEQVDMSRYMLTSDSQEDRYIELISLIFNDYVSTNGHKYVGVDFEVPDFAKNTEFDVNIDFVKNARTKDILSNDHMKNLFKIFLSSFRKYRKNATDILTDTVISSINNIVDSIESKVREKSQKTGAMDFSSFIKTQRYQNERSIFECEIFEGLTLDTTEQGNKKVNIIVGRFQPFTLGHAKVFEQIHRQNGYPVVVFLVRGKKPNPEKNPIDVDLQMRMFAAMQRQYRFLESIQVINMAAIDRIFNSLRPAYEPVLWGAGTDRLKAYGYQIDRYRDELNALPEFKMYEIKRGDEDISATKVRNAIKIDDFKTFSRMTPRSIHKFYEELKLELGVAEVANEELEIIEEDLSDAIDRLSTAVNNTTLDKSQEKKVEREIIDTAEYIENFKPISDIHDVFVNKKGFSEADFDRILKILKRDSLESLNNFSNYLLNPYPIEYFTKFKKATNISQIMSDDLKISSNTLSSIFIMDGTMKGGKGVGRGELFLGLMIDGATNASVGDVNVKGKPYEVKAREARLNTQNGFGTGIPALYAFFDKLEQIDTTLFEKYGAKNKNNVQDYNFVKRGKSKLFILTEEASKIGLLNEVVSAFIDEAICGPSGIWPNSNVDLRNIITNIFKKYIDRNGKIKNINNFNYELMYANILYYQTQEYFNGIFLINPNNSRIAYFDINSDNTDFLIKNTKYTQPSFQDNPTSMCYKITLK